MLHVRLLNYSCHYAVGERFGASESRALAHEQYLHLAPVTVHRLRDTFSIEGDDMGAILKVLQLNPFAPHDYLAMGYAQLSETRGLAWLNDCAAVSEPLQRGLSSLMISEPDDPGFDKLAQVVNPKARVNAIDPSEVAPFSDVVGVSCAWEIVTFRKFSPNPIRMPWSWPWYTPTKNSVKKFLPTCPNGPGRPSKRNLNSRPTLKKRRFSRAKRRSSLCSAAWMRTAKFHWNNVSQNHQFRKSTDQHGFLLR